MDTSTVVDGRASAPGRRTRRSPAMLALAGVLALATLGAACGDDDDDTATGDAGSDAAGELSSATEADAQEIEVVIPGGADGEFAYDTDLSGLTAGPVTVTLTNDGTLEHQAMVLKLNEGEDAASFGAAAAADPSGREALALVQGFGGPNGVGPGDTRSSTQVLEEGDYLLICVIPDDAGVPHAAHGMIQPFSVAPAEDGADVEPLVDDPADADVSLVDFGFSTDGEFAAGDTVVVANDGEQAHELAVYRLDEGATAEDAERALADPSGGPPPFTPAGGIGAVAPGGSVELTLPDEPGDYVFVCFLPDVTGDGAPHFAHGMVTGVSLR